MKGGFLEVGKITSYPRVSKLLDNNILIIDGAGQGTHTITAKDIAVELLKLLDSKQQVSNLKMDELDQITTMLPTDKVLVGTESGVKAMSAKDALFDVLDIDSTISLPMRKNIFRGNNLGSVFTDEQKKEIRDGTFRGFFPGDYWEKDGIKWRIVDIDYYYGVEYGDSHSEYNIVDHHLIIMPDTCIIKKPLFASPNPQINYTDSDWYSIDAYGKAEARDLISNVFPISNLLARYCYYINDFDFELGTAILQELLSDNVFIPSLLQIAGHIYTIMPGNITTNKIIIENPDFKQFDLCRIDLSFFISLIGSDRFMLRDVARFDNNDVCFFTVFNDGYLSGIGSISGSNSYSSLRPAFGITGKV